MFNVNRHVGQLGRKAYRSTRIPTEILGGWNTYIYVTITVNFFFYTPNSRQGIEMQGITLLSLRRLAARVTIFHIAQDCTQHNRSVNYRTSIFPGVAGCACMFDPATLRQCRFFAALNRF